MKKILMILAAVAVLASCGSSSSPADQAVSYAKQIEKAMADQDFETLMKVYGEMQEWQAGLSEEEFKEAEAAFSKYMLNSEVGEEMMDDEDFLDIAADYAVDAYETASEYAKDAYDVASEYAVEAYDVASEYAKDAYDVASEYAKDAYKEAEDLLEDLF
jgi:hypothetical protein